ALHMDSRKQELLEARFQGSSAGSASLPAANSASAAATAATAAPITSGVGRNGAFSQSSSQSSSVNPDASLSNPPPQPPQSTAAAVTTSAPPVASLANSNSQSLQEAAGTTATVSTATAARTPGKPRKRRAPDGGVGGGSGSGGGGGSSVSTAGGIRRIDEFYSANKPLVSLPPPPPPPLSAPTGVSKAAQLLTQSAQQQQQAGSTNNSEEDNNSNSGSRSSDGGLLSSGNTGGGSAKRPPGKRKKLQQQQQQTPATTASSAASANLSKPTISGADNEKLSPPQQLPQVGSSSPTPMLVDYRNNSGSDSCSQHDAAAALLYNQLQQQSSSAAVQQEQSLGGSSSQLQTGAATGQQQQQSEQLTALLKAREQLERQVANQHKLIETLRENQERGREVLRALLAEKSRQERRAVRDRCRENRLRLGQFQIVRHGSDLLDKWFDGFAFEEAHRRRQEIEHGKERIEKERRLWMKRKPAAGGTTTKSASSRSTSSAGKHSEVDADEFFTQLEIYDIQRQALVKDEKDLRDEVEKLDRERNVHIREMKRIQNEDSSRFKGNQELHDRYMLLSLLGKGGFSEVHKAYDMTEHRFVACKIHQLSPSWPKEKKDNYIRHAVREIEIHKTLQHPRIVKVYDVFDIDSDCFCTVLEYSKGCDLDFYLKQNKSLPEREARNVICQVVSALKYLNQRRPPVIHYDLKPGNILLGEGDSVADIKLTDFGLSKVMTEDKFQADSGMDLTSQGAGTYWYLPPECFETGPEAPKISSKVDVWSVGVIFYQCLYGQKPFGNNMTQADILRNHTILKALKIDFPQSTPGNCKVSEPAKNFIRRCVTYDKRLRPDVFQLAEDEYLKSKAQLKFDTTTAAYSPAEVGSGGGGSGGSSAWGLMPPPGPV
ncbi:hypothetical protein BOX15_Mlig025046g1, partial [Macrostomum lignano]